MVTTTKASTPEMRLFENYLLSRKLQLTDERRKILAAIFNKNTHFDAEELHKELNEQKYNISRATVYRTLDLLMKCELVRKNSLGSNHANYEAAYENEHHDHLICLNCKKVIEFYRLALEQLQEEVCNEQQFKPLHHSLQIFGLCSDCIGKADNHFIQCRVHKIHA